MLLLLLLVGLHTPEQLVRRLQLKQEEEVLVHERTAQSRHNTVNRDVRMMPGHTQTHTSR